MEKEAEVKQLTVWYPHLIGTIAIKYLPPWGYFGVAGKGVVNLKGKATWMGEAQGCVRWGRVGQVEGRGGR